MLVGIASRTCLAPGTQQSAGRLRVVCSNGFCPNGHTLALNSDEIHGRVAQLDRAAEFYSACCGFESCRVRQMEQYSKQGGQNGR